MLILQLTCQRAASVCVRACVRVCVRAWYYMYMHACNIMSTCIHACMHAYVHLHITCQVTVRARVSCIITGFRGQHRGEQGQDSTYSVIILRIMNHGSAVISYTMYLAKTSSFSNIGRGAESASDNQSSSTVSEIGSCDYPDDQSFRRMVQPPAL